MLYDLVKRLTSSQKGLIFLTIDLAMVVVSFFAARYFLSDALSAAISLFPDLLVMCILGIAGSAALGLHRLKLNAYEVRGILETGFLGCLTGLGGLVFILVRTGVAEQRFAVVFALSFFALSVLFRLILRQIVIWIYLGGQPTKAVLIYGAGQTGNQLALMLFADETMNPVAFVDDSPTIKTKNLAGLRVYAPEHIPELIERYKVEMIILAMPAHSRAEQARLARELRKHGCDVRILPRFSQMVSTHFVPKANTFFEFEDFLGRTGFGDNLPGVDEVYSGQTILVTGAGGSIGTEICRQLLQCEPNKIILLDHSEYALFKISKELEEIRGTTELQPILGSICEEALVKRIFTDNQIDVVFHAAAYKHLPLVEDNAIEGLRNNVIGTRIVANLSRDFGAKRFILISTDKAVRPSSAMGASKRLAEQVIQDLAAGQTKTLFSLVRFGNVLGSSGSVVPVFEEQIAYGGPVTVTHTDVTRYFMTINEATRLVLIAGSFSRGGDLFVLDMGKPVSILQIARQMIEGAGLTVKDADTPDGDIEIEITGLRPGEKITEELLIGSAELSTPHEKIKRVKESYVSAQELAAVISSIEEVLDRYDPMAATEILSGVIAHERNGHAKL